MNKNEKRKTDPFIKWMFIGIPILFVVASPLHFLFEWTGKSAVAGLFTPVNESPWEHLKLTFWPILVWWIVGYLILGRKRNVSFSRCAVSCAVAEVVCLLFITAFFYTYTGAFGIESLTLDIISLFLGLLVSILLAAHVYRHTSPGGLASFFSAVIIIAIAGAFIYFTFQPPHLPIFMDPPSGTYGI